MEFKFSLCDVTVTHLLLVVMFQITITESSLVSTKQFWQNLQTNKDKDILINGDTDADLENSKKQQKENNLARARGQVCDFHFTVATENVERLCTDPKLLNRVAELEVQLENLLPVGQTKPPPTPVPSPKTPAPSPPTPAPSPPTPVPCSPTASPRPTNVTDEVTKLKERMAKIETELQELQKRAMDSVVSLEEKEFTNVPNATEDELEALTSKLPRGIQLTGVRLSHGSYGRVEVLMNGAWGTVCDDDWDLRHANVVCRELGYSRAQRATKKGHFGRGTGPVWLDDTRCTGAESSLFNCGRASSQVNDCGHTEDAGAVCSGLPIRLTKTYSGRLEIYHNGRWGTVCDENWDIMEARVICRQMGYSSAVRVFRGRDTSPGGGPIHMTRVNCSGNEANIFDCPFHAPDKKTCTHARDAGVECGTTYCSDC